MKKLSYFLFVFSLFLFFSSLFGFFFAHKPIQTNTFYASVNVTDGIGFDINSTALTFGNVVRGGSSNRNINLLNDYPFPVVAVINAQGKIAPLLHFDNPIYIGSNESRKLSFNVIAPVSYDENFYSGNVTVELYRR